MCVTTIIETLSKLSSRVFAIKKLQLFFPEKKLDSFSQNMAVFARYVNT